MLKNILVPGKLDYELIPVESTVFAEIDSYIREL